ncbi:MAG TPA: hypothetical protein VGL75_14295 [Acidothermaceae bacterium]|jgi:hypothetical protein
MTGGPILGRYTHQSDQTEQSDQTDLRTVRLLGLPIALFLRAREHHDELIREFTLMAIRSNGTAANGIAPPPRLRELVDILGRRFGASTSRADMERDAAIERGDATVDLTYQVPASMGADLNMLTQLMDDADDFCRMETLLTLPRDPTVVAFGHWYNNEFLRQIDGLPPTPWNGPLE